MDLAINFQNKYRLNVRVGAIIEHNNKFLVYRDNHAKYDYFIGGRIHLNESSLEAIHREISEELNETVDIERLLFVTENFFYEETLDLRYHELGYYFLVQLKPDSIYLQNDVISLPDQCEVLWVDLDHEVMPKDIFIHIKKQGIQEDINHLIIIDN